MEHGFHQKSVSRCDGDMTETSSARADSSTTGLHKSVASNDHKPLNNEMELEERGICIYGIHLNTSVTSKCWRYYVDCASNIVSCVEKKEFYG